MTTESIGYRPFTGKAAMELMAPHTWAASVSPVLVGGAATLLATATPAFDPGRLVVWALMLAVSVLMQSAVNSLNDYKDFMAGTDNMENSVDVTDASIIYNRIDPLNAKRLAITLLFVAAVLGAAAVLLSNWLTCVLGLAGAAAVISYSAGPKPVSYLPLGELVSGVVMGGLICVATFNAILGFVDGTALLASIPSIVTIAMIMQVNNTCDIARDREAGRRTLPSILGAGVSKGCMGVMFVLLGAFMPAFMLIHLTWTNAALALPVLIIPLVNIPLCRRLLLADYGVQTRPMLMGSVVGLCWRTNLLWTLALLLVGLGRAFEPSLFA